LSARPIWHKKCPGRNRRKSLPPKGLRQSKKLCKTLENFEEIPQDHLTKVPIIYIMEAYKETTSQRKKQMAQLETLATVIVYGSVIVSIGGLLANIICWNILGK